MLSVRDVECIRSFYYVAIPVPERLGHLLVCRYDPTGHNYVCPLEAAIKRRIPVAETDGASGGSLFVKFDVTQVTEARLRQELGAVVGRLMPGYRIAVYIRQQWKLTVTLARPVAEGRHWDVAHWLEGKRIADGCLAITTQSSWAGSAYSQRLR